MKALPQSKLPDVGTTIFTVMSRLAADHNAINLSQGFPDFDAPEALLEAAHAHMRAGHNQYAPLAGAPPLLEQIALKTAATYGHTADPEHGITVTSGATIALYSAITALVHPGDEVIVLDPAYDAYAPAVRLAGGTAVHVPLAPHDFTPDWERIGAAVSSKTRLLIINTPHNPTGSVWSANDMQELQTLVENKPLYVLSDEVYEHMVFASARHESILRYPALAARSIVVSSFGKTFHTTGWKIGYAIGPPALMREFRKVYQFTQFCVATPLQLALADFLEHHAEHYHGLAKFYAGKRDRFVDLLRGSRFKLRPAAGTYFQLADYGAISDTADTEFTHWLTTEVGVAAIPVSVFYAAPPPATVIRFCFAKHDETLARAAEKLCAI